MSDYVEKMLKKSEGDEAEALSLQRMKTTRSSGKPSKKSDFSVVQTLVLSFFPHIIFFFSFFSFLFFFTFSSSKQTLCGVVVAAEEVFVGVFLWFRVSALCVCVSLSVRVDVLCMCRRA